MTASAGTYIKEFVHGDRGRTVPSVGSLLASRINNNTNSNSNTNISNISNTTTTNTNNVYCDCMQLDVLDVIQNAW